MRSLLCLLAIARAAQADTPDLEKRLQALEEQNKQLQEQIKDLKQDVKSLEERHTKLSSWLSGRVSGYMDLGYFWAQGDASGIRPDIGHVYEPKYSDVPDSWVFMGDPLGPTVNSLGEPATTGPSRAVTFDPVHSNGASSFILNNLNLALFAGLGPSLTFNAMVDFEPRGRNVSDPSGVYLGDFINIKLAYMEYTVPSDRVDIRIYAGKIDSTLGIEYRSQEAPDRITVTPSLICRYTCGRPIGAKIRGRFFDDLLVFAIAVTNGSNFIDLFPFNAVIDTNNWKTVSGRISTKIPVGAGLELGFSGAYGAQDFQKAEDVPQWHYGFDLHFEIRGFDLRGEFVSGSAEGRDLTQPMFTQCGTAPCLHYKGAYGQIAYRVLNWLMPYVRVDWRDAFHRDGDSFVYVTHLLRITGGLRLDLGNYVVLKGEYTHMFELGEIPQFNSDVLTTSLVVKY